MIFNLKKKLKKSYLNWFKSTTSTTPIEVEKNEQIFYIQYLQDGMTVFDIGANIGELSLLFSRFVGVNGQVHAFEASSSTFNKLTTICQSAQKNQIILNHKAIGDQEGIVKLYVYDDEYSGWNSLANRPLEQYGINTKYKSIEEIESITIDKYCQENNIDKIDLLKIDVEGAEYQVLLGAKEMLKQHQIRCCVFEFGATTFDMGNDPKTIIKFLDIMGYHVRNIVNGDPIFPGHFSAKQSVFSIHVATPKK
jgi:FkbM family methyltransferase